MVRSDGTYRVDDAMRSYSHITGVGHVRNLTAVVKNIDPHALMASRMSRFIPVPRLPPLDSIVITDAVRPSSNPPVFCRSGAITAPYPFRFRAVLTEDGSNEVDLVRV